MSKIINIEFCIAGAKGQNEDGQPNWQYIDSTTNSVRALEMWEDAKQYLINEFIVKTIYDDNTMTQMDMFTGRLSNFKKENGIYLEVEVDFAQTEQPERKPVLCIASDVLAIIQTYGEVSTGPVPRGFVYPAAAMKALPGHVPLFLN